MKNICIRCHGEGVQYFDDEDCYDRVEQDICYYCSGTGKVDDETYFHDQLCAVGYFLAHHYVSDIIHQMDNDPDGDGFELMAAENMLSSREYKRILIDDYGANFVNKLLNMSLDDQRLLVAWHNAPAFVKKLERPVVVEFTENSRFDYSDESDIPF